MHPHHSLGDVLVASLVCLAPSILLVALSLSTLGTLVALGAGGAALLRRAPTERWFESSEPVRL